MMNKIKILIITLLLALLMLLVGCGNDYSETTCDWCGKTEQCKAYSGQYVAGYNDNGSIKYGHENLWLSDSCYSKAKNSGKYTNITEFDY